jgi:penicillin-binding protein-related factor A (putative recombinase)
MGRRLIPGKDKIDEEWVKKEVKAILKKYKVAYFMPSASIYGKVGSHDFICCYQGRFITIETKAGKKKPSDMQTDFAEKVQAQRGTCLLINEHNYKVVEQVLILLMHTPHVAIRGHVFVS